MKRILVIAVCAVAAIGLSGSGSADSAFHGNAQGPGSIVVVAGARAAGFGVNNTELVAVTPSGRVQDLTSSAASEYSASWSPDGSRVVFFRRSGRPKKNAAGAQSRLYVWTPGNGPPRRIASCSFYCHWYDFQWSPDNRRIAFVVEGQINAIKVMNADGSDVHTICDAKRCGQGLWGPSWSPDGQRLVFDTRNTGPAVEGYNPPRAIWIANADGSGVRQLTQPNCNVAGTLGPDARGCAVDSGPAWSPNGHLIAFVRSSARIPWLRHATGPARLPTIEVTRPNGSHLHAVSTCGGSRDLGCRLYGGIAWAPDSEAIAYIPVAGDHRPSSFRITALAGKTATIRTCVRAGCLSPFQLSWSPNGRQLAFLAGSIVNRSVRVIGRDGKGLHRVSGGGLCCLQWVPNSSLSH